MAADDSLQTLVLNFLRDYVQPDQVILLALSGGLDSIVLLHILAKLREQLKFQLSARHVHHGLSQNADSWADFCGDVCKTWGVTFDLVKVTIDRNSGLGIEATARKERYAALLNGDTDFVALAHHQDDQAETLLLQLLRGSGTKGLAAMAAQQAERKLLRPLLGVSKAELEQYALQHGLRWIEDESNQDIDYDRNYIRHQVIPVLESRFPACKKTIARASENLADAAALLDDLATLDAVQVIKDGQVDLTALADLSESRSRNILRWWLKQNQQTMPGSARLHEMLKQLLTAKADANLKIAIDASKNVWLRRYKGLAYIDMRYIKPEPMLWRGESSLSLTDGSRLVFENVTGQGLAVNRLGIRELNICYRNGGEHFKPHLARPTRSLKHLLQEAGIPPWLRERLPLLYNDETLVAVPGLGVHCEMQAKAGEPGVVITWQQAI